MKNTFFEIWHTFLRRARYWKLLSIRKLLYFPHILDRKEKRVIAILFFLMCASGIAASTKTYFSLTRAVPAVGGSYREGILKEPRTINPLFAAQDADRDIVRLVFSGLLTYTGNGTLEPDLAEKYEISPDGKIYTVTLKPASWHDGKKVTVADVIFTIRLIQNPQYKSILRANWQGVNMEVLDERTIRFTLRTPYAPFIENLTTGIIPKHLWEHVNPEQILLHELNLKPIGSGPYKFDRFSQDKDGTLLWYRLSRNPRYYREGPYLKLITFFFFKTEDDATKALQRGAIDGFGPISAPTLSEFSLIKTNTRSLLMPRIFGIFFNEKRSPILAEKKMREAIAHALDHERIAKSGTAGGAIPSQFPLPFLRLGSQDNNSYPHDPERSRKLLDTLGWKDENGDGIREKVVKEKGKETLVPLHITLSTSDWPDLIRTADVIKVMLKNVGIEIAIEKYSFSELESSVIRPRNFEMLLFGQVYGYEPDPFAFWHSSQIKDPGLNIALYANKKVDQLLEEARRTPRKDEQEKHYLEFTQILTKDLPSIFLYTQLYHYVLPSSVYGVDLSQISLPSDRFNEVNKWYRNTKRIFK